MPGILFDLDQTLIDSRLAESHRSNRVWPQVYRLIPQFTKYEGLAELLELLIERDIPLGIVTSSPKSYCTKVIEHHQIQVNKLVCYHDTQRKKPHPEPILKGIELLGLPADEVWAIGDHVKDIQAAEAAGAHAVAVSWGAADADALKAAGAEHHFETVEQLHEFLDELTA